MTWERKTLKQRAMTAFKAHYWICVLAALVLSIAVGGGASNSSGGGNFTKSDREDLQQAIQNTNGDIKSEITKAFQNELGLSDAQAGLILSNVLIGILIVAAVAVIVGICISVFVLSPLEIGCRKFFILNLKDEAEVREIGAGFSDNYMGNVKTMFMRGLYIFLWSLLLVIPGIVKSYQYMLVPYLLAEHPEMDTDDALQTSKQMMDGHKWNTFVLQLSFIGWELLSALTAGILGVFFVNPYVYQTEAALYDVLAHGNTVETANYESYVEK